MLDATFLERRERDACRCLAHSTGAAFRILACRAHPDALRDRVALRERAGQDASEAGLPVLAQQLDRGDALDADELPEAIVIDTSQQVDLRVLSAALGMEKLPAG